MRANHSVHAEPAACPGTPGHSRAVNEPVICNGRAAGRDVTDLRVSKERGWSVGIPILPERSPRLAGSAVDLSGRFDEMVRIWLDGKGFDPAWDSAMRDWGRISPHVAAAVQAVDADRIGVLQKMFADAGLAERVALVRARILHYHQVGYFALGVHESRQQRRELIPIYKAALTGLDPEQLLPPA